MRREKADVLPLVHPKTGVYWYRKAVPERARHLFGGRREVRRSLRTRDGAEARVRYAEQAAEVEARIAASGATAPPRAATHRELVALAGEWYRRRLAALDALPEPGSAREWGAAADAFRDDLKACFMHGAR